MATRMTIRQRRGLLGWLFTVLFGLWSVACAFWALAAVAGAAGSGADQAAAGFGAAISFLVIGQVWMTGSVVLGLSAILFGSRTMVVETARDDA